MHVIHVPGQDHDLGSTDRIHPQKRLYCKPVLNAQPFSSSRPVVLALLFQLLLHSPFTGAYQVRLHQDARYEFIELSRHHMQVMSWHKAWIGLFSSAAALNMCMRLAVCDRILMCIIMAISTSEVSWCSAEPPARSGRHARATKLQMSRSWQLRQQPRKSAAM